ncbi:hypothetical protein J6590_082564 [Homalodisca vitripennis]|nr:hypothetical protein J6590_082564 [Homalodisca vitripennis]
MPSLEPPATCDYQFLLVSGSSRFAYQEEVLASRLSWIQRAPGFQGLRPFEEFYL